MIESRPAFRLLLGAEPESPLNTERAGGPQALAARHGVEDLEGQLAHERDALPFSLQAAHDVLRLSRLLHAGA